MSLIRAAFECQDHVVRIAVLCTGCYADVAAQLDDDHRRWTREFDGHGACEFCLDEALESARG